MAEQEVMLKPGAGTLANIGVNLEEMRKDAKLGGELNMQDIAIPYLYLLQSNSPQAQVDHDKYIQGATASMFYLTVIERVYEGRAKGLRIVPCYYERQITEWVDRDAGGGLVRSYPWNDPIISKAKTDDKNRLRLANGHLLVETAYHYVMMQDPETMVWYDCIMPLKSTMLKKSRKFNSEISDTKIPGTQDKAPRFLYTWIIKTQKEQKDQNVWNIPIFTREELVTADVYQHAKMFSRVAEQTTLRRPAVEAEMESGKPTIDDEVPF